jgi:hypothetical protein
MKDRKGYATVYWGKMPINFGPQAFPRHEVEAAVGYARRAFRDVAGLVPDFSVLTLGMGPVGTPRPCSCSGTKGRRESSGALEEEGASKGCCGRSPCASGRGVGEGRDKGTPGRGERRPPVLASSSARDPDTVGRLPYSPYVLEGAFRELRGR